MALNMEVWETTGGFFRFCFGFFFLEREFSRGKARLVGVED